MREITSRNREEFAIFCLTPRRFIACLQVFTTGIVLASEPQLNEGEWWRMLRSTDLNVYGGLPGHRLNAVLNYIDTHLGQPLRPRQLAQLAGVSARHLERAFRQSVGVPLHAYVIGKRVEAVRKLLLSEGRLTTVKIAKLVGFSSASHLAFAFRRKTGHTPTTFRRRNAQRFI